MKNESETIGEQASTSTFYIDRTLAVDGQYVGQDALLGMSGVVIVLGEPGVGKSELLEYVSERVGAQREDARIFIHDNAEPRDGYLIVDALDEILMESSAASVDHLLVNARKTNAHTLFLSSRSAHWDESRTRFTERLFKSEPKIVHLCPLSEREQEALFHHIHPAERFSEFKCALEDVGLDGLLGNPHNLRLIAKVYQSTQGRIESKKGMYSDAIGLLLSEREDKPLDRSRPSVKVLGEIGDDVCAKLFLSGCVGLSISESESQHFPFYRDLCSRDGVEHLVRSGLFMVSRHGSDFHELIHRTIVEYCAARYLVGIIEDPSRYYSLQRAIALVAPNGYVREDLRGLFGWLGCMLIDTVDQREIIEIDPVSVIVNGDPAQLRESSKIFLLQVLYERTKEDPSLLGHAMWDSLRAKDFTLLPILSEIQRIITLSDTRDSLKIMLIRLMKDVERSEGLNSLLGSLASDKKQRRNVRLCSFEVGDFDSARYYEIVDSMLEESDEDSLNLVLSSMNEKRIPNLDQALLYKICLLFADSYAAQRGDYGSMHVSNKVAFRDFLEKLSLQRAIELLTELVKSIVCKCEAKWPRQCDCKNGKSVVASIILDRILNDTSYSLDARQIWQWLKPMQFDLGHSGARGESAVLREDSQLRQSILYIAMEEVGDSDKIWDLRRHLSSHGHRDLTINYDDIGDLLVQAFENNNLNIWSGLYHGHIYSGVEQSDTKDPNRRLMRQHAREKRQFGAAWASLEYRSKRTHKHIDDNHSRKYRRWGRRQKRKEEDRKQSLQKDFESHKQVIIDGKHNGWLIHLAWLYLRGESRKFEHIEMPSESFVSTALRNSLQYLKVPTLEEVANDEANNKSKHSVIIAHAACLAKFASEGTLAGVDPSVLAVVKTQNSTSYGGKPSAEVLDRFQHEINRTIFTDSSEPEHYARGYVESRLKRNAEHIPLHWFSHEVEFEDLWPRLPFEWLETYPHASIHVTQELCNLAVRHGDSDRVQVLSRRRAEEVHKDKDHHLRDFWHLANFIQEGQISDLSKSWLRENKERLLHVHGYYDELRYQSDDERHALSADKIKYLFETFIGVWPKVKLKNHWGTGDPPGHTAYRFLVNDLPWRFLNVDGNQALQVIDELISDRRFSHLKSTFQSVRARKISRDAHSDKIVPHVLEVVKALEGDGIASVEDLRALFCDHIKEFQRHIDGSETDVRSMFYEGATHVQETVASQRIVNQLKPRLQPLGLVIELEDQMADLNRCDITLQYPINGRNVLLVVEVKGQWHKDLYTAACEQLEKRYMNHPDAENQGVYLVLWYGRAVSVAGRKTTGIQSANELYNSIIEEIPKELKSRIDVCVLDFSKN